LLVEHRFFEMFHSVHTKERTHGSPDDGLLNTKTCWKNTVNVCVLRVRLVPQKRCLIANLCCVDLLYYVCCTVSLNVQVIEGRKYRVIKKSLCTWWVQYRKLQVMLKVSPVCLQTFIDTPNCVLEDRVQYSTVHIPKCSVMAIFKSSIVRVFCTVIIRCTETFCSLCTFLEGRMLASPAVARANYAAGQRIVHLYVASCSSPYSHRFVSFFPHLYTMLLWRDISFIFPPSEAFWPKFHMCFSFSPCVLHVVVLPLNILH
jgi:hypothetical protein